MFERVVVVIAAGTPLVLLMVVLETSATESSRSQNIEQYKSASG